MAYTEIDDPSAYFQTKLYTAADAYTFDGNSDMQPDFVWIKERNGTNEHNLFDSVRGTTKRLESNTTAAEQTSSTTLTAFGSDGFTVGNNGGTGQNGGNYVGWGWKAGTSFTNDASSTSVGSIDSAGSVNTDAGFSIISYTGTGSSGTIAHGLGAVPGWMIIKCRSENGHSWKVYHKSIGATKTLALQNNSTPDDDANYHGDTEPTSSVFTIGSNGDVNDNGETFIAYLFAEKQGFSKFGSYIGNGQADGTYVHLGFSPAWIMRKKTSGTENWTIHDNKRDTHNVTFKRLLANDSGAEYDSASNQVDLLSNGFKCRANNDGGNADDGQYIYMAFAEQPFVTSTGVPATAR